MSDCSTSSRSLYRGLTVLHIDIKSPYLLILIRRFDVYGIAYYVSLFLKRNDLQFYKRFKVSENEKYCTNFIHTNEIIFIYSRTPIIRTT